MSASFQPHEKSKHKVAAQSKARERNPSHGSRFPDSQVTLFG
jgi:hypothetical protein